MVEPPKKIWKICAKSNWRSLPPSFGWKFQTIWVATTYLISKVRGCSWNPNSVGVYMPPCFLGFPTEGGAWPFPTKNDVWPVSTYNGCEKLGCHTGGSFWKFSELAQLLVGISQAKIYKRNPGGQWVGEVPPHWSESFTCYFWLYNSNIFNIVQIVRQGPSHLDPSCQDAVAIFSESCWVGHLTTRVHIHPVNITGWIIMSLAKLMKGSSCWTKMFWPEIHEW